MVDRRGPTQYGCTVDVDRCSAASAPDRCSTVVRPCRPAVAVGAVLLALIIVFAGLGAAAVGWLDFRLERFPGVFAAIDGRSRPAASDTTVLVILLTDLTGVDAPSAADDAGEPANVVVVADIVDGTAAFVALRPGRTAAAGPPTPNEAYDLGGPAALVRSVENLTGLSVDHVLTLDLAGLPDMVDAVGGVNLPVTNPVGDRSERLRLRPVDGAASLAYARGEPGIADGAAGRTYRWATTLRALVHGMTQEMLLDPVAAFGLLDALGGSVRADDTLDTTALWALVVQLGGLRSEQVLFLSSPDQGPPTRGTADPGLLWVALRAGPLPADYVEQHPDNGLRWRGTP